MNSPSAGIHTRSAIWAIAASRLDYSHRQTTRSSPSRLGLGLKHNTTPTAHHSQTDTSTPTPPGNPWSCRKPRRGTGVVHQGFHGNGKGNWSLVGVGSGPKAENEPEDKDEQEQDGHATDEDENDAVAVAGMWMWNAGSAIVGGTLHVPVQVVRAIFGHRGVAVSAAESAESGWDTGRRVSRLQIQCMKTPGSFGASVARGHGGAVVSSPWRCMF
ncbi:hypothetical protein M427DRAFT_47647 [Gonapodya prolifera JEL478]|uniref:Uncharacterized protein n=1 Tax=Gonapodya prolifera (strain JEL478) TaxID=1344416 RepID=A0A139A2H7_GONPJ|nr:hypothetical protein M427DRAFT_47647 [Gonapodya prolifera JEL478]|eukprot:KXS10848.1 hypothetical protein M427DRAFT_47647 [Gonapodya prolifera JEL478]